MATTGVSGLAVGMTTVGGVLLASAIKNVPPLDIVKTVIKKPTSGKQISSPVGNVASGVTKFDAGAFGAAVGQAAASVGAAAAGSSSSLVSEARKHLGARYVWATAGPTTFDCSGLVVYCLRKTMYPKCPRLFTGNFGSWLKKQGWTKVSPSQFQAGDIILKTGHMGIAVSNSRMIHAPHAGTVVKEADIYAKSQWWGWRAPMSASNAKIQQGNSNIGKGAGLR